MESRPYAISQIGSLIAALAVGGCSCSGSAIAGDTGIQDTQDTHEMLDPPQDSDIGPDYGIDEITLDDGIDDTGIDSAPDGTPAVCGDGELQPGEECDDGPGDAWDGCLDCGIVEFQVNSNCDYEQDEPSVAMMPGGRFHVSWSSQDPVKIELDVYAVARLFDETGETIGEEMRVSTPSPDERMECFGAVPLLASDGSFSFVWMRFNLEFPWDYRLLTHQYDATGAPRGVEFPTGLYPCPEPPLHYAGAAMAPEGRYVVAGCMDESTETSLVGFQIFASSGETEGGIVAAGADDSTEPCTEMLPEGAFVVAWSRTIDRSVTGRIFDSAGVPMGDAFRVSTAPTLQHKGCHIAAAPDGRFVIVWASLDQDGDGWGIFGRLFDPDGTPAYDTEIMVNDAWEGLQDHPSVAMSGDGSFIAVWNTQPSEEWTDRDVVARRFDATGEPAGPSYLVHTWLDGFQGSPDIAMLPDGRHVIVWESYGQYRAWDELAGAEIFAQRFDAAGNPIGTLPW